MTALPTSKDQVVEAIRALAARTPQSRAEMKALEADSVTLALHIQKNTQLHDVPEAVWHFLFDADIRFKDPRYAELQLGGFDLMLSDWLGGTPSNKSLERCRGR